MLSKEQVEEFKQLSKPLIKWLNENTNPHTKIIIETTGAEVVSGECGFQCEDFLRD